MFNIETTLFDRCGSDDISQLIVYLSVGKSCDKYWDRRSFGHAEVFSG